MGGLLTEIEEADVQSLQILTWATRGHILPPTIRIRSFPNHLGCVRSMHLNGYNPQTEVNCCCPKPNPTVSPFLLLWPFPSSPIPGRDVSEGTGGNFPPCPCSHSPLWGLSWLMSNPADKKPFALIRDAIPAADRSPISHRPGDGKCVTELPPARWGRAEPQRSIPHVPVPRLFPFTCWILRPHVLWARESYCTEGTASPPWPCS